MELNAVAKLEYWDGESFTGGSERLDLVVKFRYGKSLFREKLVKTLVSTRQINSSFPIYDTTFNNEKEYYNYVEKIIDAQDYLIKEVESMVKKWHMDRQEEVNEWEEIDRISKKVKQKGRFKVNVKLK